MSNKHREFNLEVLDYLICPITRESLSYDESKNLLVNESVTYAYKVLEGIAIMHSDEAIDLGS